MKKLLDTGHIYLKKYRVLPMILIFYFIWQTYDLVQWYKEHFEDFEDWQNAPIIGMILAFVGVLKLTLDNITHPNNDSDSV